MSSSLILSLPLRLSLSLVVNLMLQVHLSISKINQVCIIDRWVLRNLRLIILRDLNRRPISRLAKRNRYESLLRFQRSQLLFLSRLNILYDSKQVKSYFTLRVLLNPLLYRHRRLRKPRLILALPMINRSVL